jgi:hypothetical protein
MNGRVATVSTLCLFLLVYLAMIVAATERYPPLWAQVGARTYVLEPVCALAVYAIIGVWIVRRRGAWWDTVLGTAIKFGFGAAFIDILGLLVEAGLLFKVRGPALQIGVMIATFVLWGFAGWRAARALTSAAAGLLAAVFSAGVCAIVAVTAGFAIEFFISPPAPAYVVRWGEYQRSGWTDPRAFGLANTLDSGFTHLCLSLIVGAVFGGIAAMLGASMLNRANRVN